MTDFRETLYTIDKKGHRKWVYANLIKGQWYNKRAIVAYLLMLFYLVMPWITISGEQGILLDFINRKFTFFGHVFWATDTIFVVFILAGLAFCLFFFSAIWGRVWCGWACPETIFLEFLFRPIERLIEGSGAKRLRLDQQPWNLEKILKKLLKHGLCAFFAWILASTALAYVIGREPLLVMMTDYPWYNLVPFSLTIILMALMAFQFGWFREQFCTVLCPYARFQSALLDPHSLIVGYDNQRGEPRGKFKKKNNLEVPALGDCIDCGLCVRVCPTGIDIRNGTQLECIHCTACIDACDSVMKGLGRTPGLIRYDTEAGLAGDTRVLLRPRVVAYALMLVLIAGGFLYFLSNRQLTDFQIVRGASDKPYTISGDGKIINHLHVRLGNKGKHSNFYNFTLEADPQIQLVTPLQDYKVTSGKVATLPIFVTIPQSLLNGGKYKIAVLLTDQAGLQYRQEITLLGPG